jgi:hypothetical protein
MRKVSARCKTCNRYLIRYGKTSSGKQRYRCPHCHTSRIYKRIDTQKQVYELFKQYVLFGLTYEVLSYQSKISIKTLHTAFTTYLANNPPQEPSPSSSYSSFFEPHVLLIDGLWFNRFFVLMVYRESGNLKILRISTDRKELKRTIVRDLQIIKEKGYIFSGITTDGGKPIRGSLQKVYPRHPHQVCLAHMHRAVISNIGQHPQELHILSLKQIADLVWHINTKQQKEVWSLLVECWMQRHKQYLNEKRTDDTGRSWYIHAKVRKACRLLDAIYFQSLVFLDYPFLPKTTNEIEAQFGHLGKRWLAHRGMRQERWELFMKWFVYFYNQEQDRKRKTV